MNVQILHEALANNQAQEDILAHKTIKPPISFSQGIPNHSPSPESEDRDGIEFTFKEQQDASINSNQEIEMPELRAMSNSNLAGSYEGALQHDQIKVSQFDTLRLYVNESKARHGSLADFDHENTVSASKMDFNVFMENFTENSREYTYQNWNHFSKSQIKPMKWEAKTKKPVTYMDFTEQEKEEKKYLDKINVEKLALSACLNYQYSPDYCFNSMIDVICIKKVIYFSSKEKRQNEVQTINMKYTTRVFNDPQDSLYQKSEFPHYQKKLQGILKTDTDFYFTSDYDFDSRKHKVKVLKTNIIKTSQAILEKSFFPIKDSLHISTLINQTIEHEAKIETQRSNLRRNATIMNSTSSVSILSERFVEDFVEVDTKQAKINQAGLRTVDFKISSESSDLEPEEWYHGIMDQEKPKEAICQLNWSGEQVQQTTRYTKKKVKMIICSLNHQDILLWLRGWKGIIKIGRKRLLFLMNKPITEKILMICVIFNTFILALDGLVSKDIASFLTPFNNYFTLIFLTAFLLRLIATGPKNYLRSFFNVFDGIVVTLSVTELAINLSYGGEGGSAISAIRTVRIFRIFKALRLTRILKSLKFIVVIVTVIAETVEQYLYIAILLLLFMLIYALLGVQIYMGTMYVNGQVPRTNFDSITSSFLTLLQLLTFESWVDIITLLYNTEVSQTITVIYVVSWMILGNFVFFNLFLALLLGGFESERVAKSLQENQDEFKELQEKIKTQQKDKVKELKELAKKREREHYNIKYIVRSENKDNFEDDDTLFELLDEDHQKSRATYFLNRPNTNQDSSMEEIMYQIIEEKKMEATRLLLGRRETKAEAQARIYKGVSCKSSLYLFPNDNLVRKFAARVVSHKYFERGVIFLISISSIKLVVETYIPRDNPDLSKAFSIFDNIITILFVFEAVFKILRNGLVHDDNSYFKEPWNVVDFVIVLASVVDMIFSGISIPTVKVVRALRPLRFVSHYKHMRIVVNSLVRVIGPLVNVLIVIIIVWTIFGILAMNIVGGKLNYCSKPDNYGVTKEQCDLRGEQWKRVHWNFDNIGESLVTLFVLSSLENWPYLVASSLDSGDSESSGPAYNNFPYMWLYFIAFIFISSFFLMDLFVGVIFYHYGEELEKEISTLCKKATPEQIKWIMMQKLIFTQRSNFNLIEAPKSKFRRFFFTIVTSSKYEIGMFFAILLNIVILALDYDDMSDIYSNLLDRFSDAFSFIFLVEFIIKIIALKKYYFSDNWNLFDFFIVIISLGDFLIGQIQRENSSRIARLQFAKGLRAIRVIRLVKLFRSPSMAAFNKLINTLIFSLPTILNVMALLFLTYCIFAVTGCFIFRDAQIPQSLTAELISFENFHMALLTLFRCSTGEDWPLVMYSYGDSNGNYTASRIYFMIFILVTTFIMLNLIDLVVVSIFENFYFDPDNALTHFEKITNDFNRIWNAFTMKQRGTKIHYMALPRFFATLQEPMGFRVKEKEVEENTIEDLIMNQRPFSIRKPFLGIVLLLSLFDTPVYIYYNSGITRDTSATRLF